MTEFDRGLVFTDLDGSLLDHYSYSFQAALPQLQQLELRDIPLVPVSSKTRLEIEQLRTELGNRHPFIAENGAAIFIPVGYFECQPADTSQRDGYWVREMCPPRSGWLDLLEQLSAIYTDEFEHFHRVGVAGIVRMTGLSPERAAQANTREYSEPVKWLGDDARRADFIASLEKAGATVLQGGRFLSVAGDADKGRALSWLRGIYTKNTPSVTWRDLAIGDSANDSAMLEAAETALIVRSPVHRPPTLQRQHGLWISDSPGPAGWAEGVARWLQVLDLEKQGSKSE